MRRRNIHQAALVLHTDIPGQERRPDDGAQEIEIQAAIMRLLKRHPKVAWAHRFNSGAGKLAYENGGKSRFMRFGFPGCSDIIGQLKPRPDEYAGALLAIEVKTASGRATDEQLAFLASVNDSGGCAGIARQVEDVLTLLDKFYAIGR